MNPESNGAVDLSLTDIQRVLSQVWADVLETGSIGLDDNFFALGGNSMLAVRAIVDAESRGIVTTLVDMLGSPTIRELSQVVSAVEDAPDGDSASSAPAIAAEPVAEGPQIGPASLLQQGLLFESELRPGAVYLDVVSHRVRLPFDETALRSALDILTARHETLRTGFNLTDYDEVMRVTEASTTIPVHVHDARTGQHEVDLTDDVACAGQEFALTIAPLLRVCVSVPDDSSFWLTYGFHHAIMDGWSETVFASELMSGYASILRGAVPALPPAVAGMDELVRREREALTSPDAHKFWSAYAESLPRTRPRPVGGETVRTRADVDPEVVTDLVRAAAHTGLPVKSFTLAAHLVAWGEIHAVDAPSTGVVINGRPPVLGAERMVGLFLNLLPLHCRVDATGTELVRRVFEAERQITTFGNFPYLKIREMAGHALFDGAFNYVEFEKRPEVWIDETRIVDATSLPLLIEVVHEASRGAMRVEGSASAHWWTNEDLKAMTSAYITALTRLVSDAKGPR
ncbi:condensation domain-containing protein [Streptomyces sp. HC307]|uniref:condensation domain-containing protein n=1 Tax=Streptomyces flavusporus TaxID=3385496 RepID=UPI003917218D